ncbi:MAG: hypothetical protein OSJ71_06455 [Acetatifactor sp.]|nr:hypothetical protein [Acetatifactor sp.]
MNVVIRNAEQLRRAKEDLELLRKAWRKVLAGGQEYEIDNVNKMKRADLQEISKEISVYEAAIDSYERNGGRTARRVVPID